MKTNACVSVLAHLHQSVPTPKLQTNSSYIDGLYRANKAYDFSLKGVGIKTSPCRNTAIDILHTVHEMVVDWALQLSRSFRATFADFQGYFSEPDLIIRIMILRFHFFICSNFSGS